MRLLLDTHAVLWWFTEPERLHANARDAIENGENQVLVSAASAWEIAIKRARGRLEAPDDVGAAIKDSDLSPLPITIEHAAAAGELPPHHRDPFDRMLIAQARVEGLTVVTRDQHFDLYEVPILRA